MGSLWNLIFVRVVSVIRATVTESDIVFSTPPIKPVVLGVCSFLRERIDLGTKGSIRVFHHEQT